MLWARKVALRCLARIISSGLCLVALPDKGNSSYLLAYPFRFSDFFRWFLTQPNQFNYLLLALCILVHVFLFPIPRSWSQRILRSKQLQWISVLCRRGAIRRACLRVACECATGRGASLCSWQGLWSRHRGAALHLQPVRTTLHQRTTFSTACTQASYTLAPPVGNTSDCSFGRRDRFLSFLVTFTRLSYSTRSRNKETMESLPSPYHHSTFLFSPLYPSISPDWSQVGTEYSGKFVLAQGGWCPLIFPFYMVLSTYICTLRATQPTQMRCE